MRGHADIFVDIKAHIASGRFIREASLNHLDIRACTFDGVDLRGCKKILDLGCAYGFFVKGLAGRLDPDAHICGLDLWPECERYFLDSCRQAGYTGEFQLSGEEFCKRFPPRNFDMVLCSYTLYFFSEAIPDIARILKEEGVLLSVTHNVPHMPELVAIIKSLIEQKKGMTVGSLPLEQLFEKFSHLNGRQLLSPWFREINESKYVNSLRVTKDILPGLLDYLCFKQPKFIPADIGLGKDFIRSDVAAYFHEQLDRKGHLDITKDDTVFVCRHPREEK